MTLTNYIQTTLSANALSGDATLTVTSVTGWPTTGTFILRIDDVYPATTFEFVLVTSVNVGSNIVTVTRGQEGTTGIAHTAGAFVGNVVTAGMTVTKLDEQSGAGPTASVVLTIPATPSFRTLVVDWVARMDTGAAQVLNMQLNADAGANYDSQFLHDANVTITAVAVSIAGTASRIGVAVASTAVAGAIGQGQITLENVDSVSMRKGWHYRSGRWDADAAASADFETGHGQWRNTTTAITSITLKPAANNLVSYRFLVYGYP